MVQHATKLFAWYESFSFPTLFFFHPIFIFCFWNSWCTSLLTISVKAALEIFTLENWGVGGRNYVGRRNILSKVMCSRHPIIRLPLSPASWENECGICERGRTHGKIKNLWTTLQFAFDWILTQEAQKPVWICQSIVEEENSN